MTFDADPIWSWPVIAVVSALLLLTATVGYSRRIRHLKPIDRRILLTLRVLAALVLIVAMLRPFVLLDSDDEQRGMLLVLLDKSRSMGIPDGAGGMTRRQAALQALAEAGDEFTAISKKVDVKFYDFDETLSPVEAPTEEATGQMTAIGSSLHALLREAEGKRVLGVLLLGDGAQRAIKPYDDDPRTAAVDLGTNSPPIPVHTFLVGSSGGTDPDLAVEDLVASEQAFQGKVTSLSAKIRVTRGRNRRIAVRVLVEDRTGKGEGQTGEFREAVYEANKSIVPKLELPGVAEDEAIVPVELSFVPRQAGEIRVAIEAAPLEGEVRLANNRQETILTVQSGGIGIAYFDRIRAEQRSIRLVNYSDKIQLDYFPIRGGQFRDQNRIDPRVFDPGPRQYDAFIIGDVPASVFGDELLKKLAQRVRDGAGLLMIGGQQNFGAGGYGQTPLANLLPVEMPPAADQLGPPLRMLPARGPWGSHRIMQLAPPAQNLAVWRSLPELRGANRLIIRRDPVTGERDQRVKILAEDEAGNPLLVESEIGTRDESGRTVSSNTRVMAFGVDETFLWVLGGFKDTQQRFWRQMMLHLSGKDVDADRRVWVQVDRRNFGLGQKAEFTFGARDEKLQVVPDARFQAQVVTPKPETVPLEIGEKQGTGEASFATSSRPSGDYWVRVDATRPGPDGRPAPYGREAWTRFVVDARDLELDRPAADPGLMDAIAAATRGSSRTIDELKDFLQQIQKEGLLTSDPEGKKQITLWDTWPKFDDDRYVPGLLLLFAALMSMEWFWRKRRGLV